MKYEEGVNTVKDWIVEVVAHKLTDMVGDELVLMRRRRRKWGGTGREALLYDEEERDE